jgi:hypothetical protein
LKTVKMAAAAGAALALVITLGDNALAARRNTGTDGLPAFSFEINRGRDNHQAVQGRRGRRNGAAGGNASAGGGAHSGPATAVSRGGPGGDGGNAGTNIVRR